MIMNWDSHFCQYSKLTNIQANEDSGINTYFNVANKYIRFQ